MKLRLPSKLQAALIATLASAAFTTLSSGTLAVATGAALLAGQQAQAVSLDDAVLQTEDITSTITVDNWTANQMSVAIELDVAAFKNYLTTTWIAGTASVRTIFNVEGTWNSATGGRTDTEGLNINGSSRSKYGTPYAQATSPNGNSTALKLNNLSESLNFTASTNWDNYEAMSVVLTFNGSSEMTATWYIQNTDGTTSTYYGSNTGVKWSPSTAFTPDGTIKNIDTSMVNYMAVFDSKLNQADSATIAGAVLTRTPVDYGMEFSGDVFTIEQTTNQTFHNATFSSWYQDESGRWKKGSHTWGGGDSTYYVGEEAHTLHATKNNSFWRQMFGDASDGGDKAMLGNTIRLTRATGDVYYESQFSPYQLGGIIVEEGNSGTYVLGRHDGTCAIHIKARAGEEANMYVASNLGLSSNTSIDIESSGTWKVFDGKSLTLALYNNTGNLSSIDNTPKITFNDGVTVSMVGGGTVDMTHTGNLTVQSGATINVGEDTQVKFAAGTTLAGTINNEGTVTFSGAVGGLAHTISNEGTITFNGTVTLGSLSFFESEGTYVDYSGATGAQDGFAGDMTYTIIKGNGRYDNLPTVSYNSTNYTVDGGKISITGSTDFSTYHLNTNGADLDLARAMATASNQLTTVEAKGTNQTITVGSDQNLANLNLLAGASVTTAGNGTLTLGALSNGGTLNIGSKVTMGAVAFTSSDAPAIHVTEGGVYTILSNSTVDGQKFVNGESGEQGNTQAFTNLFKGRVVDVQAGGKLVLQGNMNFNDSSVTGAVTMNSGVAAMEITGNVQINTYGNGCTWALGNHSLEVGGDLWLTNKQYLTLEGGTLGVDGRLLLGHQDNTGSFPASLTATGGSTVTLGGIGLYGPNNAFSLTGGNLTFNTASATTNVLTNEGTKAHNNNTITLAGTTLHAGENGWTLAPVEGATVSVSGTTTVDLNGKQISLTANSINGKFVFAEGSTGTLLLNSANGVLTEGLALNGATVGFAGTWNLTALDDGSTTPTYTGGKNPGNGFAKLVTTVQLADLTRGGSITADSASATFTIKGVTGQLDTADGTVSTSGEPSYDTFHVLTDSENVSQGRKDSHDPIYSLANETTLVVDADLTGAKLTREPGATGNATLEIQANRTYTSDGNAKTITITGAGTYALKSGTFAMVDSLAQGEDGWTGTVVITNAGNNSTINEESLVNGTYSTLQMEGFNGWFGNNHWYGERNQNIKLVDYVNEGGSTVSAWKNGAASSQGTYTETFSGTWSGTGTFERIGSNRMDYAYTGNISAWEGKFLMSGDGTTHLKFYGAANTVNAAIDRTAGTLNVEVGDGTNAFTATFSKAVNASMLEIKNGVSATFEKAVTLNGNLSLRGTETAGASVLLKEGATLNSNLDLSNANTSHGTVTVAADKVLDLKGTNFWMSSNSSIVLQENATFKKGTELTVVGLSDGGSLSNTGATDGYSLTNSGYTLTNVQATVNTDSAEVQLHFDNSKFVTSHTVTLKNLQSVFSGMEIGGGTTTVGASGLTESATVTLGAVSLSDSGTLALANHVTGSVSGVEVAGSGTISGGTLQMGKDALITLGDNAVLTLSGVTVDLGSKELQGGGTRYDYGQNAGNGFAITEGKVQLVDFSTGSAIDQGTGVSYKYGSNSGTLITGGDDQGYVTFGEASYSAFYVNTPNTVESLSVAVEKSIGQPTGPLTEVYLKAGTLNTDGADPINALHIDSGDGTVYLTGEAAGFGVLDGRGTLNVAAATNLNGGTLSVAAGETLTLEGGATISYSHITNRGTLGIGTGTKVATTNNIVVNAGETFTTTGEGTLASTAELTVQGGTATLGSKSEWSVISIGNGSLNINADTTVSGNLDVGKGEGERSGDITVAQGATLTVNKLNTPWGFNSMTINGVFNATEQFSLNTGSHDYQITGTGTINTKELIIQNTTTKAIFSGGLTINVGDTGITGSQPLELRDVTVGVLNDSNGWSANRAIALGDASTGTTFNIGDGKEVTLSGAISGSGKLVKDGDGTLNLAYIINNNGYTGNIEVKDGTMVVNGTSGDAFHRVAVAEGATVELIGKTNQDYRFRYTLDGGTLTSSGNATGNGNVQNDQITLTKSSTISGSANFYMLGGSYNETSLNLGGFTLTKEGGNTVSLINTDVSTGSIVVKAGTLDFLHHNGKADSRVQADIELNGGTITGTYTYKASDSPVTRNLTVNQSAVTSAAITIGNNVTLATNVAEHQVLTLGGAITGTGNFSLSGAGTLKLAGADMISANTLTFNSGSTLDVSNVAQMAGITVNLASYTGSASYTGVNITGLNSGLTYSLTDDGSHVAITFASQQVTPPTPTSPNLGNVMYVGDSITDGVTSGSDHAKSWRYSFFQVLADGGIDQNEQGYYQHSQSSGAITETTYGGRDFENNHSARASARSWETAGVPTSEKGGDRYDYTSIQNWLGQSETKRNGQAYPADKPRYSGDDAPNTYFMLLGTNDLLSEGGNHVTDAHFNSVLASMFGYNGSTFDGTSGTFDKIWNAMTTARTDSQLIVLEMPTWSPDHTNHQYAADFAYMTKFNQKLHEWANSQSNKAQITIVNPNPGIVDVANTTKPGAGVASMFLSDHLHPSAQGELLIAGNVAKQLGYAGRTVGLDRASHTEPGSTTWNAADNTSITVVAGAKAQTFAPDAFNTSNGYTIDFGALYGDGFSGGWSASANALSVQVGDGYNIGTLTFSEAYVMWGNTVLYSRDNSQAGDNFRIAYVNQSVKEEDHVSTGYYVWMGDQLIGEALSGVSGSFNGISLTSTGANGTVKNLTWSDTAYAPTTTLYENPDTTKLFHLEQDNVLPTHNNPERVITQDFSGAQESTEWLSAYQGAEKEGYRMVSTTASASGQGQWYAGLATKNTNYEGDLFLQVADGAPLNANAIFGVVNTGTVTGNVTVQMDASTGSVARFTSGAASVVGGYAGSITGTFKAVMNAGTLQYGIIGGFHTASSGHHIGAVELDINGGTVEGNVYGGSVTSNGLIDHDVAINVAGGKIAGNIFGGGTDGTIGGDVNITITGGVITGNVNGGGTGGTINGSTNVTIEGILPSIGGNISAQNVTLKDVVNPQEYVDGFDTYAGSINATNKLTLDNYQVGEMLATVTATNLALTNGTETTINHLTTAAGTAISVDATSSLTLGQANLSGAIANAGALVLTQNITASGLAKEGDDVSYRVGVNDAKATDANYFYQGQRTESTIRVVSGAGNLQVAEGLTVTQGGVDYAMAANGIATGVTAEADYSTFYQGQAGTTVSVAQVAATAALHGTELLGVYSLGAYQAPTVLNVDRDVQNVMLGFATVNIGSGFDYTGDLLIFGGMNTVSGQVDTEQLGFYAAQASVTTFTDAPIQNGGVTFTSDQGAGGVMVEANKVADDDQHYYMYAINDDHYAVVASELAKDGNGDATVANSLQVNRVHNSEDGVTGDLTLSAGVVAAALHEVEATSGNVEFLNMVAANGSASPDVSLNKLEIGAGKVVGFYEAAAPTSMEEMVAETSVTVVGTLTAGAGAQLNANLEMASGSHLDVSGAQSGDVKGLLMGSEVTLNSNSYLDIADVGQDEVSGYLYDYLTTGGHELYYLFQGTEKDPLSLKIDGKQVEQLTFTDWTKFDKDASEVYKNLQAQTFYMVYDPNHNNVGMVAIGLVPEPTTSTLSLLALAALAARRRRK